MKYGQATAAETVRKMVVAMARDIRVLVIKLADRLHNMRTLRWMPPDKQEQKARETLEIYAPLAHRLGMNTMKWELEDLAFATLYPKMYDEIVRLVGQRAPERDGYLAEVQRRGRRRDLDDAKIKATVTGRPKHYYSVYQKMIVRGRDFADIYDLVGIRILVESVRDCYAVLGVIHARWNPVPGPVQGLHRDAQVQHVPVAAHDGDRARRASRSRCRSARWTCTAPRSSASPRTGATSRATSAASPGPDDMGWLRQLLEWQRETEDPDDFLDALRYDLGSTEVFVFTPKGDVVALPGGSTPVDFAYAVHTEVGHRCVGARVNGKLVPAGVVADLGRRGRGLHLQGGERRAQPRLAAVRQEPPRALEDQGLVLQGAPRGGGRDRQGLASPGRCARRACRCTGCCRQRRARRHCSPSCTTPDVTALYAAVGEGRISATTVVQRLVQAHGGADGATEDLAEVGHARRASRPARPGPQGDPGIVVDGDDDVWVKLARCCTPVPGDDVLGFVTRGHGVSVHRTDCVNVASLRQEPDRIVPVTWAPKATSVFLVNIQVEALDRARLLSDVTRALSDQHVNILSRVGEHHPRPHRALPLHLRDGRRQPPRLGAQDGPRRRGRLRRLPRLTAARPGPRAP